MSIKFKYYLNFTKDKVQNISALNTTLILATFIYLCLYHKYIFGNLVYALGSDPKDTYLPQLIHLLSFINDGYMPLWDFSNGISQSLFSSTTYYFDIFNLTLLFFNENNIYFFLILTVYLKTVICSLSMYYYLNLIGIKKKSTLIIFTLSWIFSGFFLVWGQHYFFATAFVYFTFSMFALEIFLQKNKFLYLSIIVGLTASIQLYLLVPMAIYIAIYCMCRTYLFNKKQIFTKTIRICFKVGLFSLLGILIFSPIIFPQLQLLLNSPRTSVNYTFSFLNINQIAEIIGRFFSSEFYGINNTFFGSINFWELPQLTTSIFVLVCFVNGFMVNKNYKELVIKLLLLVVLILMSTTNFIGLLSTFFVKSEMRMFYPITFSLVIFAAKYYDNEKKIKSNKNSMLFILLAISTYTIWYNILTGINIVPDAAIVSFFSYIIVISFLLIYTKKNILSKYAIIIVVFEIILNNFFILNYKPLAYKSDLDINMSATVTDIQSNDNSFYRVHDIMDSNGKTRNLSLTSNYNGVNIYSSLVHPNYFTFANTLGYVYNPNVININLEDNDDSTKTNILTFLGSKYIINSSLDTYVENPNVYSLGTLYNEYIFEDSITNSTPAHISQLILDYVLLDAKNFNENIDGIISSDPTTIVAKIVGSNNIEIISEEDQKIQYTVTGDDPQLIYNIEPNKNILVTISTPSQNSGNVQIFYGNDEINFNEENSISTAFTAEDNSISIPIESDFDVSKLRIDYGNLNDQININMSINSIKSIEDSYNDKVFMNITDFTDTNIFGDIKSDEDGILVFTIPYDNGWSVFANGEKLETFIVDYGMTGVYLRAGDYNIELKYNNLLFEIGCIVSVLSLFGLLIIVIYSKKYKRKVRYFE